MDQLRRIVEFSTVYLVTTVTKNRQQLFGDVQLAKRLGTMVRLACRMKGFVLIGFCILPDHVHLLMMCQRALSRARWNLNRDRDQNLSSPSTKGALSRAPEAVGDLMRSIKGTFSRTMLRGHVWQRRYHLRQVPDSEALFNVVNYIQYNFQKHHLVEPFGQEPYTWLNKSILVTALGGIPAFIEMNKCGGKRML